MASVGVRFLNLIITSILWPAFLQTLLLCTLKLISQSIVGPRSFKFSVSIIPLPWTVRHILSPQVTLLFRMLIRFDIFSGCPEGGSNHTNWSLEWHFTEVSQVQPRSTFLHELVTKPMCNLPKQLHKKLLSKSSALSWKS